MDGAEVYSSNVGVGASFADDGSLVIGQEQDAIGGSFDPGQAFEGLIDEVMVWDVVRSEEEIRKDREGDLTGNTTEPLLYWPFDEGEGTTVHDQMGNYDGTLVNAGPDAWVEEGHPSLTRGNVWNPTHAYPRAGRYEAGLKVQAESGKWSTMANTDVEVIDGTIAGYVRAADLRTPVREVRLIVTSSHVGRDALARAAASDEDLHTTEAGGLWTETDGTGYYEFRRLPLGSYRVRATKGDGDAAHEFEKGVQATDLTLNGPNQLAIDFVDLSVFPVGGRIVYSIQKNGQDVLEREVSVTAQPVGSTSAIEALPSTKSLTATGTNYSLPLFAGKYLMLAKKEGRDIRIKEDTPGYDDRTGLVTIEGARTDVDFVDHTTYALTVYVEDSGGYPLDSIRVEVSGDNGQSEGWTDEEEGKYLFTLNPGEYTVAVQGGFPKGERSEQPAEVDLTGGDQAVTMVIPSKIDLAFVIPDGETTYKPRLFDADSTFLALFDLTEEDNPAGYMYYYAPEPRTHTYTVQATSNGHPVEGFTLLVTDEVSMMTVDAPQEQDMSALSDADQVEYRMYGGLPKKTEDDPPLAAPKNVSFRATKDGYTESDPLEDDVIVLGERPVGTAAKIVSIPVVNYTVLHDPPGDGSYAYLDDKLTVRGMVKDLTIRINSAYNAGKAQTEYADIPVYPSPWSSERTLDGFDFGEDPDNPDPEDFDLEDRGLLGYRDPENMTGYFIAGSLLEAYTGGLTMLSGPAGYAGRLAKYAISAAKFGTGGSVLPGIHFVQYEISPQRTLRTPSGDTLPDILGPGKGDVYFGEGWTLGLQTKHFLGIRLVVDGDGEPILDGEGNKQWELNTEQIETYDILSRTNQYLYTIRDIENIINDLDATIGELEDKEEEDGLSEAEEEEMVELRDARSIWRQLLKDNLAYVWNEEYVSEGLTFDDFTDGKGSSLANKSSETLIFSAGPAFEYSRTIEEGDFSNYKVWLGIGTDTFLGSGLYQDVGPTSPFGETVMFYQMASSVYITTTHIANREWDSGTATRQSVGFVLHDDDVGDNISTRVYTDPQWGTPLFFQDLGSRTSDPWEGGTNRAVDVTLELLEGAAGTFDYQEGAHYTIKVRYTGERDLESDFQWVDFALFAPQPDNEENLTVTFNGAHEPYIVRLNKEAQSATIALSMYPPDRDRGRSAEREYPVTVMAQEVADAQIVRTLALSPTFADLRAPRATVLAPYEGERVSPVFFPVEDPFEIEVVSEDTDLESIQLQIRSKQPDGVWEPWRNLSGMLWEADGVNENVTTFDRLERRPPRREFTFQWTDEEIRNLGVGEYGIRAVATDSATTPNRDLDPPAVVFLVDEAEPSVLSTLPDYQARESARIYGGELSATFTDDMRAHDFTDRTFYVTDLLDNNRKVAGYVSYSPALRKAVFVPIVPFKPNGFYRVQVKTDEDTDGDGTIDERGVHDLAGNPLDNAFMWTFRTMDMPFEPIWAMVFRVTDGVQADGHNVAGVEYGAMDEEDEQDARAVPALASQMRMSFLNRDRVAFDRDIRPADGRLSHHWFFVIDNAANGSTVTLWWQPSLRLTKTTRQYQVIRLVEFDEDGTVANTIALDPTEASVNPETGEIDPVVAYTYVNEGESSRYFRLDVQKVGFVAGMFPLGTSGWRFFSVPITPQRAEPFVNLGDDIDPFRMYQYDTGLGGYKIYPFDIGEVGLQTGYGYFTRISEDVEADVGGALNQDDLVRTLSDVGWHTIGNPFVLPVEVDSLLVDGASFEDAVAAGWVEGTLYRWNVITEHISFLSEVALSDGYAPVTSGDSLYCWEGYWLRTRVADLELTIPAPSGVLDAEVPLPDRFQPPMARLVADARPSSGIAGEFDLRLELHSVSSSDLTSTLGTRSGARVGWDLLDRSDPPTLGETVSVYFDHADWGKDAGVYNTDYRPILEVGGGQVWSFTVFTDMPDAEMALSWEDAIEQIPDDIMLYLRFPDQSAIRNPQSAIEWLDMRETRALDLCSSSRIAKIPFEVRAERHAMSWPSDVEVTAEEQQVLIRWTAEENPFVVGYVVERMREEEEAPERFELSSLDREFVDRGVEEDVTYIYRLLALFGSGAQWESEPTRVTVLPVVAETALLQSYPNPGNPEVWIPYALTDEASVVIEIHNTAGQLVRVLDLGVRSRGRYLGGDRAAYWDGCAESGERVTSGIYLYTLRAGKFAGTRKMIVLK